MDDTPRLVATSNDDVFSLTVEEALEIYAEAGLSRTPRTVQRYCANSHLNCRLRETRFGEKYMITPELVAKHIAYVMEVAGATGRALSRQAEASRSIANGNNAARQEGAAKEVLSRHVESSRYLTQLEGEVLFLRGQIGVKDAQIKDLTERARETNHLIAGLQRMLSPLLGGSRKQASPDLPEEIDGSGVGSSYGSG